MGTVLEFKPRLTYTAEPENMALACECGSVRFWLVGDGTVECAECADIYQGLMWGLTDDDEDDADPAA